MTCVYSREEDKLSACIKTTPSCIEKKKSKFCFCIWTRMTWPLISESTFPSRISFHNSWKTAELSKMLFNNDPLTVQRFELNALSPEFLGQCLLSTYWKLLPFLESIWFFFYDFWTIEYLISLFNSKAASRVHFIILIALMVSPTANWKPWLWQCIKWACDSVSFICVATPVLAPTMLDASSWY